MTNSMEKPDAIFIGNEYQKQIQDYILVRHCFDEAISH